MAMVLPPAPPAEEAPSGLVSLVGAGPGDPELLTLRAWRRLEAAEVVLHDNLISEDVLGLIPASAELVNVGKRCGDPKDRGLQQREIHELLLAHSRRGRRVVRLKCGDPFIFGRGGEELEFLTKHGAPTEVVPGVTSAAGAAASLQMPLTHRDFGVNSMRFLVGQSQARKLPDLDWKELAESCGKQTSIFYMGMRSLSSICEHLLEGQAPPETPMALVESATLPDERRLVGTLKSLPELARQSDFAKGGPVLIFLGPTAAFPEHLDALSDGRPRKRARAESADAC